MRRYQDLTDEEKKKAVERATSTVLQNIIMCEFYVVNGKDLTKQVERAAALMDRNGTPWFIAEEIMRWCGDDIRAEAQAEAEAATYLEAHELMPVRL